MSDCPELPNNNIDKKQDPFPDNCGPIEQIWTCDGLENLNNRNNSPFEGLDGDPLHNDKNLGSPNFCDPMLLGKIVETNDVGDLAPDKSVIYRYSKGFRAIDLGVKGLFANINVIDSKDKVFNVPIIWGTPERAAAAIVQANVRKDNTGVVDRLTLPLISIYSSSFEFAKDRYVYHAAVDYKRGVQRYDSKGNPAGFPNGAPSRTYQERYPNDTIFGITRGIPTNVGYTITLWTAYEEDMKQILEQILMKFSPVAYINVATVPNWEHIVELDSISNNLNTEPGDAKRIFIFQVNVTAKSAIAQPIVKRKSVLKTRIEIADSIDDNEVQKILKRIETEIGQMDV